MYQFFRQDFYYDEFLLIDFYKTKPQMNDYFDFNVIMRNGLKLILQQFL